jgi:hypothetical protein
VKNGQKIKLGDAHAPQEISKRYKHQSLGMPPRHPDEGMTNGSSIFAYLVFGPGGVSVEEITRPMKIAA